MKKVNTYYQSLPVFGLTTSSISSLSVFAVLLLFQCTSASTRGEELVARPPGKELNASLKVLDSLVFQQDRPMSANMSKSVDVFDSLVTILEPFDARLRIFNRESKQLIQTVPLKKVEKTSEGRRLVGGTARAVSIRGGQIFVLEQSTPKIVEYDFDGTRGKISDIPEAFKVPMEKPGVFNASSDGIVWSFDDVFGRRFLGSAQLGDEDGIICLMEDDGEMKVLLSVKDLRQTTGLKKLPYLRAAEHDKSYFIAFTNQAGIYEFDERGRHVATDTSLNALIDLKYVSQDDFDQRAGIFKILVSEIHFILFVRTRKVESGPLVSEIIGMNRETGDYWKTTTPNHGQTELISLRNDTLAYLVSGKDGKSVVYFARIELSKLD